MVPGFANMTIRCPQCAFPAAIDDSAIGESGQIVTCEACGTRWLARRFDLDPYARRPALQAVAAMPRVGAISDAVVIEHIGAGFARLPPHRREESAPRRAPVRRTLKVFGAILGAIAFVMVFRAPIVSALPELASMRGLPDEVDHLEFQRVRSETVHLNGVSTFFVEGEIVNRSAADVRLPAIRVTLKSPDGATMTSWLVEPSAAGLGAGRSVGFRSALASPPEDATQVTLSLAAREQQIAGLR